MTTNVNDVDEVEEQARSKMGMPIELYTKVEEVAKERDISVRAFIREVMAKEVGYDGPLAAPRQRVAASDLADKNVDELRKMAAEFVNEKGQPRIKDAAKLNKEELVESITKARRQERAGARRKVFTQLLQKYGGNLDRIAALLEEGDDDDEDEEEDE